MRMLGSAKRPMALLRTKAMRCLQTAWKMPKDQRKRWRMRPSGVDGGLSERERAIFVDDLEFLLEQIHGQVGIFGDGVDGVAAAAFDSSGAPRADGTGYDDDHVEKIESTAFEVLARDVFECLPAGPEIDAVANLCVSGYSADALIFEVRDQA